MKKAIFVAILILMANLLHAEKVRYAYDKAGNRVRIEKIEIKKILDKKRGINLKQKENLPDIIQISLNSVSNRINITINKENTIDNCTLTIFDINGRYLMSNIIITEHDTEIDLSSYPKGIYVCSIKMNGIDHNWKIIKK